MERDSPVSARVKTAGIGWRVILVCLLGAPILSPGSLLAVPPEQRLHAALEVGNARGVSQALALGADPNAPDEFGISPLHKAAMGSSPAALRRLLRAGARPRVRLSEKVRGCGGRSLMAGDGVLAVVVRCNSPLMLEELLVWAEGLDLEGSHGGEETALGIAARQGSRDLVRQLLAAGAAVDRPSGRPAKPPLTWALEGPYPEVARRLLEAGASPNGVGEAEAPLHTAVRSRDVDSVRRLLIAGADPNVVRRDGWTPLCVAQGQGQLEIAKLLIQHAALPCDTWISEGIDILLSLSGAFFVICILWRSPLPGRARWGRTVLVLALAGAIGLLLYQGRQEINAVLGSSLGRWANLLELLVTVAIDLLALLIKFRR